MITAGTRLGSYEILAPIGAGGMGEVYRARDRKLARDVAIKVLPESVAADPATLARFEREAKAVAALSHPNILSIFDFGSHAGVSFAVTELLEGETLREKLDAAPIPQTEALGYALQIARGLSAAHGRGIVHRDLKPENVFIGRDGYVKILDFGLAKRNAASLPGEETSTPTVSSYTDPGTVMGTVSYMSPEQVRGLPVDQRSDIFSFGAILYELLSGKKAFQRATVSDTMASILRDEPTELSESGRSVSPALVNLVRHCLEKDRDNRFQTARDVAFNLSELSAPVVSIGTPPTASRTGRTKALIAAGVIVVLVVGGALLLRRPGKSSGKVGGLRRVAVLPFENLGAPEDDYFADGMADAVRGKLTSLPGLQVIARSSSTPYKKTTKTPRQIAADLDVGYLLTATVRWQKRQGARSRVEVSPELVEIPASGAPTSKWQQPFDAALTDVFQVQSDIASRVARELGVALGAGAQKRLSQKPTQNLAAYGAFLKGEEATNSLGVTDAVALRRALKFYEQAAALDPGFAQAWARVSRINSFLYFFGVPAPSLAEHARQAAEKAIALDPEGPEGYLALGAYERVVDRDTNRALAEFAKGQRVAPANAELVRGTAALEQALGHWEAAVEHFRQATQLDPRSAANPFSLGGALLYLRRYPEARDALDRGLSFAPGNVGLIEGKAMTFLGQGNLAGARAVLKAAPKEVEPALVAYVANSNDLVWVLDEGERQQLLRLTPDAFDNDRGIWALCLTQAYGLEADAANVQKYAGEARNAFEEQLRVAPEHAARHAELGVTLAYLGRKEKAIEEGQRAVELLPVAKDAAFGPYFQHQLARIYILVGEPEKALDQLEPLLKIPYYLSPGWLAIDPNFDPLRKNLRFQKLAASAK